MYLILRYIFPMLNNLIYKQKICKKVKSILFAKSSILLIEKNYSRFSDESQTLIMWRAESEKNRGLDVKNDKRSFSLFCKRSILTPTTLPSLFNDRGVDIFAIKKEM
jgi:hypothetical protein